VTVGFENGGAIYYDGSLSYPEGTVLRKCTFQGNSAPLGGGGALLHHTSNASVINCSFTANNAEYGAAVANGLWGEPTFVNCAFSGNHAYEHGGGLYTVGGTTTLANCTLNHNSADHVAGGLANYGESVLTNCLLWENTDSGGTDESAQIYGWPGGETVVNHSCVQGWTGSLGGDGNFGDDPAFVDPLGPDGIAGTDDDDLTLSPGSPCIDAGHNCALYLDPADLDDDGETEEFMPFDLAMNERFEEDPATPDTGLGFAPIIDIGAYEYQTGHGPCEGDLNGDRQVDLTDLATLLAVYGIDDGGDLNCDGITDLTDLSTLLAVYGTTCE
jgi:predicted outer membrane repeat protein